MESIKKIALFQDMSGIGRCALAVAVPVVSALGCQACAIPTALLSGHTGFGVVEPFDCTTFVKRAIREWEAMDRAFDCVLTGYMPSGECVRAVRPFVEKQKRRAAITIVDPAMADGGKLYRSLESSIVEDYRLLCRSAGLITPNVTEARLLTGETGDPEKVMEGLLRLSESAIITGVEFDGGRANVYMRRGGEMKVCRYKPFGVAFPGTGDLLAANLAAHITLGAEPFSALEAATTFVSRAMELTIKAGTPPIEGVIFELA
ncbi:MAG: bifunctional hydroxymethylpyrimidine kinase/phosphomethylpyrimidine kinase [Clostridia bacterium]|nr:bifunctional hydroxymethylpyrimidine kinase/phosphomethylpyrimidine kinase [Clostridia bacterium]